MTVLPPDWKAGIVKPEHPTTLNILTNIITASLMWDALTKPQRELLLSAAAGAPVAARADVRARLVARGLIGENLKLSDAGESIVQWRTR